MSKARDIRMLALWRDDPAEARLTVDLRIDAATGAVVSVWDVFGAFDLDGGDCRPFVLRRDGTLDFGAASGARWKTNLRGVEMKIGASVTVHWNESDSGEYGIVKIAALGARAPRE